MNPKRGIFVKLCRVDLEIVGAGERGDGGLSWGNGRPTSDERNGGKPGNGGGSRDALKNRNLVLRPSLSKAGLRSVTDGGQTPGGIETHVAFWRDSLVGERVEGAGIMEARFTEPATMSA